MADSTGLRPARFLSPSTVMMGSKVGFEAARKEYANFKIIIQLDFLLLIYCVPTTMLKIDKCLMNALN